MIRPVICLTIWNPLKSVHKQSRNKHQLEYLGIMTKKSLNSSVLLMHSIDFQFNAIQLKNIECIINNYSCKSMIGLQKNVKSNEAV